jgi:hypothetical protein
MSEMKGRDMATDLSSQRLFEHPSGNYILLTKTGLAVHFYVDRHQQVWIRRKLENVDFNATGDGLKADGWRCIGPGNEFNWVLEAPVASEPRPTPDGG